MDVDGILRETGGSGIVLQFPCQNALDGSWPGISKLRDQKLYRNDFHTDQAFEVMQSLRKDKVLCDINLVTDNGTVVCAHKVVLASTCPYFHSMFSCFEEYNKDQVIIKGLDSTALILLVDFFYTAQIIIDEENVKVLLPAANFLQLQKVQDACCDLIQSGLHPTNCLEVKALANLYGCTELLSNSELYIKQHFSEVVDGNEFLSLSSEQVIKLISSDVLAVSSEEKVFDCVIRWIKHELSCRKHMLPDLMEHVRLPLIPKHYLFEKVLVEPLLKNSPECQNYITETLIFHLHKNKQFGSFYNTVCIKPRKSHKVNYLVVGRIINKENEALDIVEWYQPSTKKWQSGPKISLNRGNAVYVVLDSVVFAVGGSNYFEDTCRVINIPINRVDVLDLSLPSPGYVPTTAMNIKRNNLGVAVLDNRIYAGIFGPTSKSAEFFDIMNRKWQMIANMSTRRDGVGVGVLNNLLYAIGGHDFFSGECFKSVERYDPSNDTWMPVAEMNVGRHSHCVGVLDGVIYAIGGLNSKGSLKSVEAYSPSTGVWTIMADMYVDRIGAGVVALDGLLYVVGGESVDSKTKSKYITLSSVECYYPITNTWTVLSTSMNIPTRFPGVAVINNPPSFNT